MTSALVCLGDLFFDPGESFRHRRWRFLATLTDPEVGDFRPQITGNHWFDGLLRRRTSTWARLNGRITHTVMNSFVYAVYTFREFLLRNRIFEDSSVFWKNQRIGVLSDLTSVSSRNFYILQKINFVDVSMSGHIAFLVSITSSTPASPWTFSTYISQTEIWEQNFGVWGSFHAAFMQETR